MNCNSYFFKMLCIGLLLIGGKLHAQLELQSGVSGEELAQTLVGAGVLISNIELNCPDGASGTFNGTYTNLNIDQGIVLSSGAINVLASPNNQGGATGQIPPSPGDPDLDIISGGGTNDACVLEFDVVPYGDTLRFNYVFGSEEYLEFVGSYNDAFALLLSGDNPAGGNYNNVNIALVPNTNTPVTINNVNTDVNSEYYVDNGDGTNPGPNSTVQLDGFTVPLKAKAAVIPCQTYHLKLAVADALDNVLDSSVFIEAESLGVPVVSVSATTTFTTLNGYDNTVEGCIDGIITFSREGDISYPLTVPYELSGTATNGIDYAELSGQITIPAGESSIELYVETLEDNISEGNEILSISVSNEIACADSTIVQTAELTIEDQLPLTVSGNVTINLGETATLAAAGGSGSYSWTPSNSLLGANTANPTAFPTETTTYTVTSNLGTCNYSQQVTVTVISEQPCITQVGTLAASGSPACSWETVQAAVSGQILDDSDVIVYYLHNNPNGDLNANDLMIYSNNTSGSFSLGAAPANSELYITAVAGNNNGQGGVDLNDECLSVSNTVAVRFIQYNAGWLNIEGGSCSNTVTATAQGTQVPQGAVLMYILHNSYNGNINMEGFTIYASNNNGAFDNTQIPINTTAYITAVVGAADANGNVVLTDECLAFSNTVAVLFSEYAAGTLSVAPNPACSNATIIAQTTGSIVPEGAALVYVLHNSPTGDTSIDGFTIYTSNSNGQFNSWNLPPNTIGYVTAFVGDSDGNGGINFNSACLSASNTTAISWIAPAIGTLNLSTYYVCQGGTITTQLSSSNIPDGYELTYVMHNSYNADLSAEDFTIYASNTTGMFSQQNAPANQNVYITAFVSPIGQSLGSSECVAVSNTAGAVFLTPIQIEITAWECEEISGHATATFVISGGIANYDNNALFSVEGDYNSEGFTVAAGIPFNVNYVDGDTYFISVSDESACSSQISGEVICQKCITEAGSFQMSPQMICDGGVTVALNSGAQLLQSDKKIFVIHTQNNNSLGTVLATNSTGSFSFENLNPALRAYNQPYYLSAIAGPADANGNIMMNHPCTDIALGPEIVFLLPLSAAVEEVCNSEEGTYDVILVVNGGLPSYQGSGNYEAFGSVSGSFAQIITLSGQPVSSGYNILISDGECSITVANDAVTCLPPTALELLRFEGNIEEKGNLLIWTTAQEINHKHFELQRSQDGIHFETIAIIQGKGNSSSLQEYEYLDKSTENGINYYRLLSISTENEHEYSQIIALQRNSLVEIALSPIPASDYINISLTTPIYEPCEINLYDLTGRIVLNTQYSVTQTHQRLELSNLPQGIYTLCLQNSTFFVKRILVIE